MCNLIIIGQFICFISEEAKRKYGEENIKIYESLFVNLYFALSETKQKTHMKLVCLKPQEKVIFIYFRNGL